MTERLRLFRDRLVGLIVGVVLFTWLVVATVLFGTAAIFERKVQWLLATLPYEVFGQAGVTGLAGYRSQLHQRHLGDLMARIAVQPAFFRTKSGIDVIGETAGRIK